MLREMKSNGLVMNILYIGPYRQNDGWGNASRDFVLALLKSKHTVTTKPIYMSNNFLTTPIPVEIEEAEKGHGDYDIVIQHVLPTMFVYNGAFKKNVGMFFSETSHLERTPWPYHCNFMDEIIVSSQAEKRNLEQSGVTSKIRQLHIPLDVTKFDKEYNNTMFPGYSKPFNFYFIGEYTQRKNINAFVFAFHLEFKQYEPVNLILKTNKSGTQPPALKQQVQQDMAELKKACRIYAHPSCYKEEIIITDFLSEEKVCNLHASCDCFVMPSHGEAWCRPAIDAMGFGNTPIVTEGTGMSEFIDESTGWVIPATENPVICLEPPITYLYTAHETWLNPNINRLRKAMREAYSNQTLKKEKAKVGINRIHEFSYNKIAEQINESY